VAYQWLEIAFRLIAARGIEPHEVIQVLNGPVRRPVLAYSPEGVRLLTIWGRTNAGRPLIVTVRLAGRDGTIVGAKDMTAAEKEVFEAWETSR
jgi:hypothetical protein